MPLTMILVTVMLAMLFLSINSSISLSSTPPQSSKSKLQPFECGFESFSSPRVSFSLKYFMVVVLFLVFDIEMLLVFPIPLSSYTSHKLIWYSASWGLLVILAWGLVIEWHQGTLSWVS